MQKIKNWWIGYKQKPRSTHFWDAALLIIVVMLIIPEGRVLVQRGLIKTGIFGGTEANASEKLDQEALEWIFQDVEGNAVTLAALNDKPVFLNFWATWCAPCRAEMPSIISLMENTEKEAHFVLLTYDNPEKVKKFLEQNGWDLPVYFPLSNAPQLLDASSLPTTLVINTQGEIIHRSEGMRDWSSKKAVELLVNAK